MGSMGWFNIDGFTVGEQREIYAGIYIFELAKQTKSLRHCFHYNLKVNTGPQLWITVLTVYDTERRLQPEIQV